MGYLLVIITAVVTICGNVTAKLWADGNKPSLFIATMIFYIASSISFPFALKYGKLSIFNAFATVFIFLFTSAAGVLYFKEKLTGLEMLGLFLAFSGIMLLSFEAAVKT